ncbi:MULTISPECIES: hypothetical protein [Staphylococcaceae]|uniref:Uncharacterized protein n=1 Tax=Mammaliicoccus sciuri TaxID=1296 RepID=A0ABT7I188_MAMSC|nr:hypothetical protein [Staphylococcus aureus]MDL0113671.1 hypothetical protein [Mammaliicoccus sciuri]MCR0867533.1 hypothetical protein [Staphylococcus aureus]MDL0118127.1 hypothetical protein [Mammaliicoccus sciuri]SUK20002.1 Uncharacterised protein [Staphylococcus aureus]SUK93543.1 Uncharacterised protein [Staphylococcus aureus]
MGTFVLVWYNKNDNTIIETLCNLGLLIFTLCKWGDILKKVITIILIFLILLITFMLIRPDLAKFISGFSLVISIFTFLSNMYYNDKAEEHKRISNMPLFLFDSTEYSYELSKDFVKNSIQIDIFNNGNNPFFVTNDNAKSNYIGNNKNHFLLKNVGGVAKDVTVESEVIWDKKEFKNHNERIIYEDYERELTCENNICYLYSEHDKWGFSTKKIIFNTHTKQMKIKGVSKENHLLVSIPNELSYATNFYLYGYIASPPKLLVNIQGKDLSGNKFTDEIEIKIQRFKLSYSPVKAEITLFA